MLLRKNTIIIIFLCIGLLTVLFFTVYPFKKANLNKYMYLIAYNETIYGLTNETINPEMIGDKIGEIVRYVGKKPERNGDLCITSTIDMMPPNIPIGSNLFEIKGISKKSIIAIEVNGNYLKLYIVGRLKQ